jgi:hypothetical protein
VRAAAEAATAMNKRLAIGRKTCSYLKPKVRELVPFERAMQFLYAKWLTTI